MVLFNYSTKELTAKVVYYGPGLCGKTTNLQWIHEKLPIKNKGKMLSLATETDRTLFFDFLPIEIGTIRGMRTRIQLYTVPGQVFYNATRRMVLKGADCVVFVCDSQEPMLEANLESYENLRQNLEANEIDPEEIPMVLQYNKRDLPNALPIEILNERINPRDFPFHEAVAIKGIGVEETLKGVTKLVFKSLSVKYGTDAPPASGPIAGRAAPVASRPAPAAGPAASPRPSARTATLPPVASRAPASSPEDLLDNLGLTPVPEAGDEEVEIPIVEEEEAAAMSGRDGRDPKETMVSSRSEADELRRRISMPSELEVSLEQIEEEEDEIEEISLDTDPLPGLDFQAPLRAPAPPRASTAPAPTAAPPPAVPEPPRSPDPTPVRMEVQGAAGETTVTLPVELLLPPGAREVRLNLRLTLKLKRG